MRRLLFFIFIAAVMSCETESNLPVTQMTPKFQQSRQDAALDLKIQPILNQYFAVMDHLEEKDSADLNLYGIRLIQLSDSLTQIKLSLDTATQHNAAQGLINIQYEITAILMSTSQEERLMGAQMLSLHLIDFLATIGYQKQTIYIYSDASDNQWIGLNKKSKNPYLKGDNEIYQASQVLQELK